MRCYPDMGPENAGQRFHPTIGLEIWTFHLHHSKERWNVLNHPRFQTSKQVYGKRHHTTTKYSGSHRRSRGKNPLFKI